MKMEDLPVIDWESAIKLAGNKKELAEEILCSLIKTLPEDLNKIKACYDAKNYPQLLREVHKLHGAVCYCGLPRLKTVLEKLETQLKTNIMDCSSSLLNQLDIEVRRLLEAPPPT